jgi:hypothetical protein
MASRVSQVQPVVTAMRRNAAAKMTVVVGAGGARDKEREDEQ